MQASIRPQSRGLLVAFPPDAARKYLRYYQIMKNVSREWFFYSRFSPFRNFAFPVLDSVFIQVSFYSEAAVKPAVTTTAWFGRTH